MPTETNNQTVTRDEYEAVLNRLAKAERRADEATKRADRVEREREAETARATVAKVEEALVLAATKAGFLYPDLAPKIVDRGEITVGEDGQVKGCRAAVERFLAARPHTPMREARPGAKGGTAPATSPRRPGGPRASEPGRLSPEALAILLKPKRYRL